MKSYLWQWLVLFLISSYYGHSFGKPILSTLVRKIGRGVQKAVGSLRKTTTPVSSSNAKKSVSISNEDSKLSKNKSDSELEKLSDEELMAELEKVANLHSEGTTGAREIRDDIQLSESSGKSLSQAIDSVKNKMNSSEKKLKCVGGGGMALPFFFVWFQQLFKRISLLRSERQATGDSKVSDTVTRTTNRGLFGFSALVRLLRMRLRQRHETESINKNNAETQQHSTPTKYFVEEYVDETGVIRRRFINAQSISSAIITEGLSITQNPKVEVDKPGSSVLVEAKERKSGLSHEIEINSPPPIKVDKTESSTPVDFKGVESGLSHESITNLPPPIKVDHPASSVPVEPKGPDTDISHKTPTPSFTQVAIDSPTPPTGPEVNPSLTEGHRTETVETDISHKTSTPSFTQVAIDSPTPPMGPEVNPSLTEGHHTETVETDISHKTPTPSFTQVAIDSPTPPTGPEVNPSLTEGHRTETVETKMTKRYVQIPIPFVPRLSNGLGIEVENLSAVRQTTGSQTQPNIQGSPSNFLHVVPGGIFLRNSEPPQLVYFDTKDNIFKLLPRGT